MTAAAATERGNLEMPGHGAEEVINGLIVPFELMLLLRPLQGFSSSIGEREREAYIFTC